MKEALRLTAPGKLEYESEAVRELKEALKIPEIDHEKWIELPRRFSRSSARFGLPMDTRELASECFYYFIALDSLAFFSRTELFLIFEKKLHKA